MSELHELLASYGQEHLIKYWDELDTAAQLSLRNQIEEIDFEQLVDLAGKADGDDHWAELAGRAEPPPAIRLDQQEPISRDQAVEIGEEFISSGKVAAILVAGGQGTRLGFDAPKGMFPIGPLSGRTLFQIHFEKILALEKYYGAQIPLLVMTSPATHDATVRYLEEHQNFGISPDNFQVFCQGTMPAVSMESGKVLLESKDRIFTAPNGHGGTLQALHQNGCLDTLAQRGIEKLFYWQVDNPMVQVCDPLTLGYHLHTDTEFSLHACAKRDALHKVGNIVAIDGKTQIIEYSDLPETVAQQTNSDGTLKLWAGSIAVHVFNLDFLKRMTDHAEALPFHVARKKVPFVDESGNQVNPQEPNAFKFERFIFDLLPMAERALVVEVDPNDAFAPLKNASGAPSDTPETVQAAMMDQARRWLHSAEVKVDDQTKVEVSPLYALNASELKDKVADLSEVVDQRFFN